MNDGPTRVYGYVGPPELRSTVRPDSEGPPAETSEPFTFVVALDRRRRDGIRPGRWTVHEVTNHSTGYCPDLDSSQAVDRV
ncbi:hypothetical protein ABZY05_32230 [Streptomyces canus]|uniref:hypothetical protein n=1 Tax=Streptomyces canus TaxID=58343 RepID=UPI0033B1E9DF